MTQVKKHRSDTKMVPVPSQSIVPERDVNDIPVLLGLAPPVSASIWWKEISMLLFMLALFCFAAALEKQ